MIMLRLFTLIALWTIALAYGSSESLIEKSSKTPPAAMLSKMVPLDAAQSVSVVEPNQSFQENGENSEAPGFPQNINSAEEVLFDQATQIAPPAKTSINEEPQNIPDEEKSEQQIPAPSPKELKAKTSSRSRRKRSRLRAKKEPKMLFSFDNTDLVKIIDEYASLANINIIFPQGANAITQKITFKKTRPLSLEEARKYIDFFLDMAGYTLIPQDSWYLIKKTDPQITHEALPWYVDVNPDDLPQGPMRIRAIYYLDTLKVPEVNNPQGADPLSAILRDMLTPQTSSFMFDVKSNAIILSDKANNIASVMKIILELDAVGSREIIEIIPLFNSSASTIATMLMQKIVAPAAQAGRPSVRTDAEAFFSSYTRIVADPRTNSLIIMGKEGAVERLKEFIRDVLDVPTDSGKSVLHTYDLQYLDSESFAKTLQEILRPVVPSGQASKEFISGPERFFDNVIVVAEAYKAIQEVRTVSQAATTGGAQTSNVYSGGNRLIIACKNQDWPYIKALIEKLDEPQAQVILEVLIVDLQYEATDIIATQLRNLTNLSLPEGVTFQSAQATAPVVTKNSSGVITSISGDLLQLLSGGTSIATQLSSPPVNTGSLIISLNDPAGTGIFGVLQILDNIFKANVLQHPFLVALNNTKAEERFETILRVPGDATTSQAGVAIQQLVDCTATIKIAVIPRISSPERLNLQLSIEIDNFTSGQTTTQPVRSQRKIKTDVNIGTGQILVLGGLTQIGEDDTTTGTPILSKIPLVGWLFKNSTKDATRNNLAVFICPTIVQPRLRISQHEYTNDKVDKAYRDLANGMIFDNMRDPITRFFFDPRSDSAELMLDEFVTDAKDTGLTRTAVNAKNRENTQATTRYPKKTKAAADASKAQQKPARSLADLKGKLASEGNPLQKTAAIQEALVKGSLQ